MTARTDFPQDAYTVVEGWSAVEAVGPDATRFLQGFCTNDVAKVADGDSCEAMFTDARARVVAYGWVGRLAPDRLLVLLGSTRSDTLLTHLDRYVIREDVELKIVPPGAWKISHRATDAWRVALDAFGPGVTASKHTAAPTDRRELPPDDFERLRVQRGVPLDGLDVDQRNLPQEVDRNDYAISFTKGCYLGQEPVARIDALGRVNWLLRGLRIDGSAPPANADLLSADGKPVGRVTSSVADEGGSIALAYVRREVVSESTTLTVSGSTARVVELPMF